MLTPAGAALTCGTWGRRPCSPGTRSRRWGSPPVMHTVRGMALAARGRKQRPRHCTGKRPCDSGGCSPANEPIPAKGSLVHAAPCRAVPCCESWPHLLDQVGQLKHRELALSVTRTRMKGKRMAPPSGRPTAPQRAHTSRPTPPVYRAVPSSAQARRTSHSHMRGADGRTPTGLPTLKGPRCGPSMTDTMPATRSDTYWKLRVCCPSPYTVMGLLVSA